MERIDLHTHSTASDGTLSPSELVSYAYSKGIKALALTDHDTVDGLKEALGCAEKLRSEGKNIEVIPGIEFSTEYFGRDVHIVGLFIDYDNEYLKGRLTHFIESREKRNKEMCRRLTAHGMEITYDEMLEEFPDCVITRAHFANMLLKKGYVKSKQEAFDKYIGDRKPCYIPRKRISPARAVEIIRRSGGFPIFAHPVLCGFSKDVLENLVRQLSASGLMGIEAVYSTYEASDERDIRELASKYDLCLSGGSDFHGNNKNGIDLGVGRGRLFVPDEFLSKIRERYEMMKEDNDSYRLKKILFTDLDDTLLKKDKTISEYTHEVLKRWSEAGHYIALCSGRDISSVNAVKENLKLDFERVFTIGYNGGQIYDCTKKETLYRIGIEPEDVRYLVKEADKAGIYMHTYAEDHFIVPKVTEETLTYTTVIKTPYIVCEDIVEELEREGVRPCKCLLIELKDKNKLVKFKEDMKEWCDEHEIEMMFSTSILMEVIPKKSGKGNAVAELKRLLDNPGLCTVGAGDEQNDISMLKACDIAIGMLNGIDEIKDVSTVISEDIADADGLAKTLEGII